MSDETTPTATDEQLVEGTIEADDDGTEKLDQIVEIKDAGPCKKHIKVTVQREQIDEKFDEKFTELTLSDQPQVHGFRPGKASAQDD